MATSFENQHEDRDFAAVVATAVTHYGSAIRRSFNQTSQKAVRPLECLCVRSRYLRSRR
jgi:hypothetical protein